MIGKEELQAHYLHQIQEEYYTGISKTLINKLLIVPNTLIKEKQKMITTDKQDEILNIANKICNLHLYEKTTKNNISEFIIQDTLKIIRNMHKIGIQLDIQWPDSLRYAIFN